MNARIDKYWMAQAIRLAKTGRFTTTPNPNVGCIIVNAEGKKIGQGAHLQAGNPHAEVYALREAKHKTLGATVYVTLEPCSHYGRTPPCADALIDAKVARVVIANTDPNPSVDGSGIDKLRKAGIEVTTGVLAKQAKQLNLGFFKRMTTGLPYVRLKLAATLDGKTALANGTSQWITGSEARRDVQHFRAASCVVLTGSGTVREDNPSLLVRPEQAEFDQYPQQPIRQPLRVVVEGQRALATHFSVFNDEQATLLVSNNLRDDRVFAKSVETKQTDDNNGHPNLHSVLRDLGQQSVNDVWVESGAKLAGALLEQKLVDELIVYVAGKLIGHTGLPLVELPQYKTLDQVPHLQLTDCSQFGNDIRLTYSLSH